MIGSAEDDKVLRLQLLGHQVYPAIQGGSSILAMLSDHNSLFLRTSRLVELCRA